MPRGERGNEQGEAIKRGSRGPGGQHKRGTRGGDGAPPPTGGRVTS